MKPSVFNKGPKFLADSQTVQDFQGNLYGDLVALF